MNLKRDMEEAEMVLVGLGSEFDVYGIDRICENTLEYEQESRAIKVLEKLENTEYAWLIPACRDYLGIRREKDLGQRNVITIQREGSPGVWKTESGGVHDGAGENNVRGALEKLWRLLDGKNYFLVSQAQNGLIPLINWREGRLVMPCGSRWKKQCVKCCECKTGEGSSCSILTAEDQAALYECCEHLGEWLEEGKGAASRAEAEREQGEDVNHLSDEVRRALRLIEKTSQADEVTKILREKIPEGILGICPRCGAGMVLNVVQAAQYDEKGYLSDWDRYTKWLQGSVNRKLLILELGVGMQYPGMIRIPFERTALLNRKSRIYRIHEKLYQVPDHLGEKGVGIAENAIDWLNNL